MILNSLAYIQNLYIIYTRNVCEVRIPSHLDIVTASADFYHIAIFVS